MVTPHCHTYLLILCSGIRVHVMLLGRSVCVLLNALNRETGTYTWREKIDAM